MRHSETLLEAVGWSQIEKRYKNGQYSQNGALSGLPGGSR